jgi:arsenate reductase (glutaredoxin)
MLKIYHNPRCSKSREGLAYLMERHPGAEVILYLENPLSPDDLRRLFMKLNCKPADAVRQQEELYRKELKGKNFTDEEWISIIVQNPKLLQRPIVEGKYRAVVGFPPSRIEEVVL